MQVYESRSPVDLVTVTEELARDEAVTRLGGTAFLVTLCRCTHGKSRHQLRRHCPRQSPDECALIRAGQRIAGLGYEATEFPAMLEQSQSELLAVADAATETKPESIKAVTEREDESRLRRSRPRATQPSCGAFFPGFQNFDYYFNGFAPGCSPSLRPVPAWANRCWPRTSPCTPPTRRMSSLSFRWK